MGGDGRGGEHLSRKLVLASYTIGEIQGCNGYTHRKKPFAKQLLPVYEAPSSIFGKRSWTRKLGLF